MKNDGVAIANNLAEASKQVQMAIDRIASRDDLYGKDKERIRRAADILDQNMDVLFIILNSKKGKHKLPESGQTIRGEK